MLTKSDFLRYLEAPLHLWGVKNQAEAFAPLSPHQQVLIEQGCQVETLAVQYLQAALPGGYNQPEILTQKTLTDGYFQARVDLVVYDRDAEACDLYEIKSATGVRTDHIVDAAFQCLVAEASLRVRRFFLVHLDKTYSRGGEINPGQLFVVEDITAEVRERLPEVRTARDGAWQTAESPTANGIPGCSRPKTCPCPTLCHPDSPEYPIYDLTRLSKKAAASLVDQGIKSIAEIPEDAPLSDRHRRQRTSVLTGQPVIDLDAVRAELGGLHYPLNFLDFETCNPAVPLFPGYHPYQHIVFQFSVHTVSGPGENPEHHHFLATQAADPVPGLLVELQAVLGEAGSVVVWNQAFEASRIREMGQRHGAYKGFLDGVNDRMVDLMRVFSRGAYIHPDFHGSASLKTVLPVLMPDFEGRYAGLDLSNGGEAMAAWLRIAAGELPQTEVMEIERALLAYCALDTLALVKIWQVMVGFIGE